MELIKKLEIELKVTWHKANLSRDEKQRSDLLAKYWQTYALLRKQRVQVAA